MAIRISASGEYLQRTANLPSSTAFTMCGWCYRVATPATFAYFAGMENTAWPTDASAWNLIGFTNADVFEIANSTGGNAAFATNYGNAVWFFWAITCAGTAAGDHDGYAARATDATFQTVTLAGGSFVPAQMMWGNDTYDEWVDCRLAALKVWDAALTEAELMSERWYYTPVRHANLNLWSPGLVHTDLTDYGPNGRTLTAGGTLSTEEGPPIQWSPYRRSLRVPYTVAAPGGDPEGSLLGGKLLRGGLLRHGVLVRAA